MTELCDADAAVLERLSQALGAGAVGAAEPRYLEEPRGRYAGRAGGVVRPGSTEAVAEAVRICAEARVPIVPYSGGTGLVGGQVASGGPLPLVMSFERLDRIREVSLEDGVVIAEAGCILADVHAAAENAGRLFPLTLASEGSARIGGLLGTNAGGVNVLRYGNARDLCLGIEAVMADGSVLHGLGRVAKDNMGYDLRHLLIGAEGTLGLITAASLRLFPRPGEVASAWVSVASPMTALALRHALGDSLGGTLTAFELIHRQGLDFLAEVMPQVPVPPGLAGEWFVLAEAGDAAGSGLDARLEAALAAALEDGRVADALIAQSEGQRRAFWEVREAIPEANRLVGAIASHDISVPPSRLEEFLDRGARLVAGLAPGLRLNCFGHLGDGNLHYNMFPPRGRARGDYDSIRAEATRRVHDLVDELGGSVGAEHGVGRLKAADLARYGDPGKVAAMRAIKAALDPLGILNPGAVLA